MGVVLIKWVWPKNFHTHSYCNPTILEILDPPLQPCPLHVSTNVFAGLKQVPIIEALVWIIEVALYIYY